MITFGVKHCRGRTSHQMQQPAEIPKVSSHRSTCPCLRPAPPQQDPCPPAHPSLQQHSGPAPELRRHFVLDNPSLAPAAARRGPLVGVAAFQLGSSTAAWYHSWQQLVLCSASGMLAFKPRGQHIPGPPRANRTNHQATRKRNAPRHPLAPPHFRLLQRAGRRSLGLRFQLGSSTAASPLCCASCCWLRPSPNSAGSGAKGSGSAGAAGFFLPLVPPRAFTFRRKTSSRRMGSLLLRPPWEGGGRRKGRVGSRRGKGVGSVRERCYGIVAMELCGQKSAA